MSNFPAFYEHNRDRPSSRCEDHFFNSMFQLPFGTLKGGLVRRRFDNCVCAVAETLKIQNHYLSLVLFHTVRAGAYWRKIDGIYTFAFAEQMEWSIISCHAIKFLFFCFFVSEAKNSLCNFKFSTPLALCL